ncbi:hypothetical protein GQ457_02G033360 [Hibiscus cannabinus]
MKNVRDIKKYGGRGESSSSAAGAPPMGVTGAPPMGVVGPSSSVNQGYDDVEVYRPEFYPSESSIYPNFGENVNVQEMTNLSFSPEIMGGQSNDYLFTTPPPMPSVIEEDFNAEEDLNAQQRPQRNRRAPQSYLSTTPRHGQKLHRK